MDRSIVFRTVLAGMLTASATFAGDDLFSELEVDSVYRSTGSGADASSATSSDASTGTPTKLAGPASLGEALRNGGFDPQEVNSQYLSVDVPHGDAKKSAFLTVSDDRQRIHLVLPLTTLAKGQSLSTDRLASLMDANRADRASHFAFSAKLGRIELHRSLENSSITGERLRDALQSMVAVADDTAALWRIEADAKSTAPAASAGKAASAPASPESPASLVGSWSATRSKTQAFALRLGADGTFALVTVNGTQTAKSSGSFELGSGRLTLKDAKAGNLAGAVKVRSADEFEFTPDGAAANVLTFKRAK